jgi:hypothetical protein
MKSGLVLNEAVRDARSHIEKGTGLSDLAVERICLMLLYVVRRNNAMAALEAKLRAEGNPDVLARDARGGK